MEALKFTALYREADKSLAYGALSAYSYPWEALGDISAIILKIGATLSPAEYKQYGEHIWVAKTATVAPSSSITGPCIICPGAEIRHCAFLRGATLVGAGAVVGNSTELKNCILFDDVQVPHYNYVGDSILGYRAHLGAGVVTSNVKNDKTSVAVLCGEERISSARRKCGAMLGDYVEVGCNSVLNPGTVIGCHTSIYPLSTVRGYVPANSIFKSPSDIVTKH